MMGSCRHPDWQATSAVIAPRGTARRCIVPQKEKLRTWNRVENASLQEMAESETRCPLPSLDNIVADFLPLDTIGADGAHVYGVGSPA
jgi:hypothetical protein